MDIGKPIENPERIVEPVVIPVPQEEPAHTEPERVEDPELVPA